MTVEFLPSDEPGEVPEQRPDALRGSHRRGWWLVVALFVAGATAWVVTRPSPTPPHTATPPPTVATRVDPDCRGVPDCAVRVGVSPAIGSLARAYLPAGVRLHVHTVIAVSSLTQEDLLVERDIEAVVDSVTVLIRVQRGGSGTQEIVPHPPGASSMLLHQVNSGFVVRLQYLGPITAPPMVDRLEALIRDPRLATA